MATSDRRPSATRTLLAVVGVLVGIAALVTAAAAFFRLLPQVLGSSTAPWVLARAGGLAAYLLLVALVMFGLLLSHPGARRLRRPSPPARLAIHVSLAVFTLAFTVLHVVALVVDPWAHVGWVGALLPLASSYRPAAVTLGVVALWASLITGLSAAFAGRGLGRLWWPVHKVAALVLVLAWLHGLLAGSDTRELHSVYLWTALAVTVTALSRYLARTPSDLRSGVAGGTYGVPLGSSAPLDLVHDQEEG